jgi:MFS family permease
VFYVLFEIPWVMAVKRFGPNKVLALALVSWSTVTIATGFVHNYHQAIAVRILLGACEAGIAPGFAYIFSTIYPQESVAKRIALTNFANAISGKLAHSITSELPTYSMSRRLWWAFCLRNPDNGQTARPFWYVLLKIRFRAQNGRLTNILPSMAMAFYY